MEPNNRERLNRLVASRAVSVANAAKYAEPLFTQGRTKELDVVLQAWEAATLSAKISPEQAKAVSDEFFANVGK